MAALQGVTLPWNVSNTLLDIDYIYRWSGYKSASPLLAHLKPEDSETLDDSGYNILAGIVWSMFGTIWSKKWEVLTAEYNPLENYNMTEGETTLSQDVSSTSVFGNANNNRSNTTSTHNVYGYNSGTAVPAEQDSVTVNTMTDIDTDFENNGNIDRTLTRRGNIGVTTTQQMAQSTLDLYAYRFFEEVYKDVDSVTSLPIYDGEISGHIYSGSGSGSGTAAVTSINGKTGDVILFGSDIDLTTLISESVADAISALNVGKQTKPAVVTGILAAGATSLTLTDSSIGDNSTIDIYMNKSGVNMTGWTQTGNTLTMTFDAYGSDVLITLEVYNG